MNINIKQLRQLIKEERAALQEQDARARGRRAKAQRAARKKAERKAAAEAAKEEEGGLRPASAYPPAAEPAAAEKPAEEPEKKSDFWQRRRERMAAEAAAKTAEEEKKHAEEQKAAEAELIKREKAAEAKAARRAARGLMPKWAQEACFDSDIPDQRDCVMKDGALYRETEQGRLVLIQTPDHDPAAMAKWKAAQHEKVKDFKPERVPGQPLPGYFAKQQKNLVDLKRKIELQMRPYQQKLEKIDQGLKKLEADILKYAPERAERDKESGAGVDVPSIIPPGAA